MFYGKECPHCHVMMPLIDKLEKEQKGKIKFERLEVWHNKKNLAIVRKFKKQIQKTCGEQLSIPIFFDEEKKRSHCGEMSYKDLKKWVLNL